MPTQRQFVFALLWAFVCCGGRAPAQLPNGGSPLREPGIWHKGKYLGYVPAHLRGDSRGVQAAGDDPGPAIASRPALGKGSSGSAVAAAAYQEEIPAAPLPLAESEAEALDEPLFGGDAHVVVDGGDSAWD